MSLTEKNINEAADTLLVRLKRLATMHIEYARLYMVEKLAIMLSTLMVVFLLVGIGLMCFFYITQWGVSMLAASLGDEALGHVIVAFVCLLVGVIVFLLRRVAIVEPVTRFLIKLFDK